MLTSLTDIYSHKSPRVIITLFPLLLVAVTKRSTRQVMLLLKSMIMNSIAPTAGGSRLY